jgi:hypothetical protein
VPTYACYDRKGIYAVGNTPREAMHRCRLPAGEGERMIAAVTERAAQRLAQLFAEKRVFFAWDGTFIGRGPEGELLDMAEPLELELADWYWRRPLGLRWSALPEVEEVVLSEDFVIRRSGKRRRRGR